MAEKGQIIDYDVVVVGAGAAGIAATQALTAAGHSVICVEAANRVGGRAHTDTKIFGVPFDMGAHWMHCEHVNALKAPGLALGLDLYPDPGHAMVSGLENDDIFWDEVSEIYKTIGKAAQEDIETEKKTGIPTDRSLADVFAPKGPWSLSATMTLALSLGRDMPDTSLRDMVSFEGGKDWYCREGFGHLVARTAEGLPIKLSTPVSAIKALPDGVRVTTEEGVITARAVVVTASVGVLAEDVIRFDPPLEADRRTALDLITMGDYNHTALLFRPGTLPVRHDTWLRTRIEADEAGVPRGGDFLCDISGTGLTSFETSGSFSRALQEAGPKAAIDHALETLAGLFGSGIRQDFVKGHATAWRQEPFVRGSYSGALCGGYDKREVLRRPHAERIHFAGEATHRGQQSSVSGAHLEGLRAAGEILEYLG